MAEAIDQTQKNTSVTATPLIGPTGRSFPVLIMEIASLVAIRTSTK
jgi:hypothetical protein